MDLELGDHYYVKFTNPDVISYAQSAAPKNCCDAESRIRRRQVSIIACPVDYCENLRLTDRLGQLDYMM